MIKKINIFLVLLLLLVSVSAVSAADDGNITELTSDEAIMDTLEVSADEDVSYSSDDLDEVVSVENDSAVASSSYTVTDSNYGQYFSVINGKLVSSDVKSGDTIILDGTISNKTFIFNIPVNIVGSSSNNMKNSMLIFKNDASNSAVSNLNIVNTANGKSGVVLDAANYCTIKDCIIKASGAGSYPISVINGANYNNITGNDLKSYGVTYGHGTRSTPGLIVSGSHYNYIANNHVEVDDANGIYLSSYSGKSDDNLIINNGGNSNFNIIYNNTVKCNEKILPTSWSYNIQIMGNNNTIKSNTVYRGYRGISTSGSGNVIVDNMIINLTGSDYNHPGVASGGEYGIVATYNSYVANNKIIGAKIISTGAGISAIDNSIIENNLVEISGKGRGIVGAGSNVIIRNNVVVTESGSGIYQKDDGSGLIVDSNNITSVSGTGILIEQISPKRMPKNVTITNNVISTNNKYAIDAAGVQADTSNIDLESNTIIGGGLVNSPAGVIDTSKPVFIFTGKTHTITPSNIRQYINDNGGLTSEIGSKDILNFEGTFSNEVIYITKPVKITGKNPVFYNSTFKVTSGGVQIENLTIINAAAERVNAWGIFVNQALGVKINNNKISVNDPKAAYAVYVLESSGVEVSNNILTSQGDFLTFTLLSYACEECIFANNTIHTIGTGETYSFSPEKCIDGNELVINGRSYCLDGNELVIDGKSYCLDGNELVIDGRSYCLDGNELVIDGTSYCLDGNEFVIDGTRYCLDGNELSIDGAKYTLNSTSITINGKSYCLDGEEVVIDGKSYCLDGNELVIDGRSYCLDGNELVIDGNRYCVDGNEYCMDGAHVVSEIYQTYGILLLYSSNNVVSGNDVNVTSALSEKQDIKGNKSSQNSIVGIDLYFNCHNNTISDNNVFVSGKDNYIYGMGVLGYFTGHSAPEGQGATNNSFIANKITLDGLYCVEGIIIGDESEDTFIENNELILKSEAVVYGIYFELSQKSYAKNNSLTLNSQAVYGIEGYNSNDNVVLDNVIEANAKKIYGILFLNGNNNVVSGNKINSNAAGGELTTLILDSIQPGNAGIYLMADSANNNITGNEIKSNKGYAVNLDDGAVNNNIVDNYLESEKGIANNAVNNPKNNNVADNYIYIANVSASDVNVKYLGTGLFTITTDKNMDGAIVKFYDVDGKYFAQSTVKNGKASVEYKLDASYTPGQYLFSAKLSKENYKVSTSEIDVDVAKGDIVINLADVTAGQGDNAKIVAIVADEFGNPVRGAVVEFNRVNSVGRLNPIGSAVTDKNGNANISYTVDKSLEFGSYDIVAIVKDVDNYNGGNATSKLIVVEKISFAGAKNYAVYYGNTVKYKIQVKDANTKKALAGKLVTFKINGKTKSVYTDKNGYATYSVKLATGSYTISATCNGYGVSKKITFKPTVITKNLSKKKAKTVKFTAKLVNKNGKILKNKKITFKVNNKKYSAKTNSKGIATLSLKNLKVGKYTIYSSYGGCKVKNTLTIKK